MVECFNCYESFCGHPAPEKGQKKSKASGGPAGLAALHTIPYHTKKFGVATAQIRNQAGLGPSEFLI